MIAEAEVDQEGRIVLSEALLEKAGLQSGSHLRVECERSYILIQTRPPGLYMDGGVLVYDHGRPLPPDYVERLEEVRQHHSFRDDDACEVR